jgi:hypothetical protein
MNLVSIGIRDLATNLDVCSRGRNDRELHFCREVRILQLPTILKGTKTLVTILQANKVIMELSLELVKDSDL